MVYRVMFSLCRPPRWSSRYSIWSDCGRSVVWTLVGSNQILKNWHQICCFLGYHLPFKW